MTKVKGLVVGIGHVVDIMITVLLIVLWPVIFLCTWAYTLDEHGSIFNPIKREWTGKNKVWDYPAGAHVALSGTVIAGLVFMGVVMRSCLLFVLLLSGIILTSLLLVGFFWYCWKKYKDTQNA